MIRLLLLTLTLCVAAKLLFSQRPSWLKARRILGRLALTGAAACTMLCALWSFGRHHQAPTDAVSNVSSLQLLAQAHAADESNAGPSTPAEEEPSGAGDSPAVAGPEPAADDQTMVLFVSNEELQQLVGEEGVTSLSGLEGLQRAYAMIPLSPRGLAGVPPVLREALMSPAALRQVLSPSGLRIMSAALAQVLAKDDDSGESETVPQGLLPAESETQLASPPVTEEEPHVLASWVRAPGVGQVVVKSDFVEASTSEEDALRAEIVKALKARISRTVQQSFGSDDNWEKLVDVSLTDESIRESIVATDVRTEVIETSDGVHPMQQTFALVEFPEDMEREVVGHVETALRSNRVSALCLSVGALWLAAILFSAACRFSQSGSLLRKLATFPVMALLIVPCLIVFAFLVGAMIKGATFEFKATGDRVSCIVDRSSSLR